MTTSQNSNSAQKNDGTASFDEVLIKIQPGDIITSKKGLLSKSPLTGKFYIYKRGEYRGGGLWIVEDKEEVDIAVVQRK